MIIHYFKPIFLFLCQMLNLTLSCYLRYKLKIGATKRTETEGFQVIYAEKWFKHENYVINGFKNDVALIKMKSKFKGKISANPVYRLSESYLSNIVN